MALLKARRAWSHRDRGEEVRGGLALRTSWGGLAFYKGSEVGKPKLCFFAQFLILNMDGTLFDFELACFLHAY